MFIIVGLGNPDREYNNTRHNVGFDVIDRLAAAEGINMLEKKHKAIIGKGYVDGVRCILAKPMTYMNLSGESVRELVDYYKVDPTSELIIISDDISLQVGALRTRKKGSAGGHNGLKNIIKHLGNEDFMRMRMGVGEKPKNYDLADYVLGHFPPAERKLIDEGCDNAVKALRLIVHGDVDRAMNEYNFKKQKEAKPEVKPAAQTETDSPATGE